MNEFIKGSKASNLIKEIVEILETVGFRENDRGNWEKGDYVMTFTFKELKVKVEMRRWEEVKKGEQVYRVLIKKFEGILVTERELLTILNIYERVW